MIPPASSFAAPVKGQALPSEQTRKRRRRNGFDEEDDNPDIAADQAAQETPVTAALPGDVPKLDPDLPAPTKPFPHAGAKDQPGSRMGGDRWVQKQLSELRPPLHVHRAILTSNRDAQFGSRMKHVGFMTTLFHRALVQGKDQQAFRIFTVLLAMLPGKEGKSRERLRLHGFWALASELIMRGVLDTSSQPYSAYNLRQARLFLESLALQFPVHQLLRRSNRTTAAVNNSGSALDFYNSMFAVWIYEVTKGRHGIEPTDSKSVSAAGHLASVKGHAVEIATRLDTILSTMEYTLVPQLLVLRAHVEDWLGQVTIDHLVASVDEDKELMCDDDALQDQIDELRHTHEARSARFLEQAQRTVEATLELQSKMKRSEPKG